MALEGYLAYVAYYKEFTEPDPLITFNIGPSSPTSDDVVSHGTDAFQGPLDVIHGVVNVRT
jgi:hypothetical protein